MAALVPSSAAVSIDGGLSRNCYFTQFLADVLEREVRVADNAELTGTGTARLAALACGRPVEAVGSAPVVRPEKPRGQLIASFAEAVQARSEARRGGKEGVRKCGTRCAPPHANK